MGIINLSFCYPKNLFLIFELLQFDESRYCTERIFYRKKRSCSVDAAKCPNFSVRLCLGTRGKWMLANFRLKIGPFWDSDFLKRRIIIIMMMTMIVIHVTLYPQVINGINKWQQFQLSFSQPMKRHAIIQSFKSAYLSNRLY